MATACAPEQLSFLLQQPLPLILGPAEGQPQHKMRDVVFPPLVVKLVKV